jgi:hypothetical protein
MQRHQAAPIKANEYTCNPVAWKIRTHFPQAAAHWTAQWHPNRPSPLCPQQICSDEPPFNLHQTLQPFSNWLSTRVVAEEN